MPPSRVLLSPGSRLFPKRSCSLPNEPIGRAVARPAGGTAFRRVQIPTVVDPYTGAPYKFRLEPSFPRVPFSETLRELFRYSNHGSDPRRSVSRTAEVTLAPGQRIEARSTDQSSCSGNPAPVMDPAGHARETQLVSRGVSPVRRSSDLARAMKFPAQP